MQTLSFVRAALVAAACALVFGCVAPVEEEDTAETEDALKGERYKRIVHARVYQQGHWTLPGRDAAYAAGVISKLRPTYVSGLVRLETPSGNAEQYLQLAADYHVIKQIVREENPGAKFDIVLNIRKKQYAQPDQIKNAMAFVDLLFSPDGWFFDFLDNGEDKVVDAAITYAHSRGQFIGGNLNGGGGKVPYARRMDFVAITNGTDIKKHVANLDYKGPVLVHIENNPHHAGGENAATAFLKGGVDHRKEIVRQVARAADRERSAAAMYPVFFPLYPLAEKKYEAYDASKDGLLPAITNLLGKGKK